MFYIIFHEIKNKYLMGYTSHNTWWGIHSPTQVAWWPIVLLWLGAFFCPFGIVAYLQRRGGSFCINKIYWGGNCRKVHLTRSWMKEGLLDLDCMASLLALLLFVPFYFHQNKREGKNCRHDPSSRVPSTWIDSTCSLTSQYTSFVRKGC
jgi:hypothetical protein